MNAPVAPTVLFLSPQLDDVAFSCGGTAARLAASGVRCHVLTLFTRSVPRPAGFALACQTDKGIPADVDYLALRRAEDAAAMRALGAEPVYGSLPEAPHRGYGSAAELFGPLREGDDGIVLEAAAVIASAVASSAPALVVAPLGMGGHVDHRQALRALAVAGIRAPVTGYRDTPYALRDPLAPPAPEWTWGDAGAAIPLDPPALAARLAACAAYATQLPYQFARDAPPGTDPAAAMRARLSAFARAEGAGRPAERFAGTLDALAVLTALFGGERRRRAGSQP